MHSSYDSVQQQTGLFAGQGGYDIHVGNHTQLDGAVIGSTASADKNRLDTGTLGWSNIDNQAVFSVSHSGIGLSASPSLSLSDMMKSAALTAPSALMSMGRGGNASSTTYAAVSDGALIIRNQAGQQQDIATLSRDVEHANNALSPIFDKEKEQKRLQTAQMVGELGSQVMEVIRTEGEIRATRAAEASGKVDRLPDNASEAAWDKYRKDLTETSEYKAVMASYGTGSDLQRAAQAATAAIQSLAGGGNLQQALAGASAPYLAQLVKSVTMPADERKATASDIAANAMGHALMGAVVAQLSGKDAVAGAVGAAGGELTARLLIMKELYGGRDTSDLTEAEKQSVSALASLAAGLASGIASGSVEGAATGAQAGRNAVENNFLSPRKAEALNKAIEDQKVGRNLVEASQIILRLTNEDRASNLLLEKYQRGEPLSDDQKQELAGLLNQYGYELQTMYGYSPHKAAEAIQGLVASKMFVASTNNTQAYNEALSYLKGYSVQSGQAASGTDALLALPGAPGIIARSTLAASGGYQAGTGIGQVVDGNYGDGVLNIGLGTTAIFGSVAGQGVVSKPSGGIISQRDTSFWQNSTIGNNIAKSDGTLAGRLTPVDPKMTQENIRSLNRENESAQILSQSGFYVEQNPSVAGNKNPDYRINGEIFDNYAPKSNSVRNIYSEVKSKIDKGQTSNVVINMSDTKVSVPELQKQLTQWPIMGLDKVIVIDKTGNAIRVK